MATQQQPAEGIVVDAWLKPEVERHIFRQQLKNRLPFVFGVTGHRDIAPSAVPKLEDRVRQIFKSFKNEMPNTPLVVLTALAHGADRLVARVAVESGIDAQIVVPLPMPQDYYEKDFLPDSVKEFRSMLTAPNIACFELPVLPGAQLSDIAHDGEARNAQYALSGAYIAAKCHLLIALWDGIDPHKFGGTAEVVRYKLHGVLTRFRPVLNPGEKFDKSDPLELGPVYHIVTPRDEPDAAAVDLKTIQMLYPKSYEYHTEKEAEAYYLDRIFGPIERFNSEGAVLVDNDQRGDLVPLDELTAVNSAEALESLLYLDRLFTRADQLAIRYGNYTRTMLRTLTLFVFAAAFCFDLSNEVMNKTQLVSLKPLVMLGFPLLMIAAFLMHWNAHRNHYQDLYQDYRALAEGLRVQFFWQLSGIDDSVSSHYLGKQRSELSWIRRACMVARMFLPPQSNPLSPEAMQLVKKHWIENQHGYFTKQAMREHRKATMYEWIIRVSFWSGLVIISAISLFNFHGMLPPEPFRHYAELAAEHESLLHASLMLLVVMTAVLAALLHNYVEKSAVEYHAKQYHRMAGTFRTAARRIVSLAKAKDHAEIREEIHLLGTEALAENGDWVLTHRDRPLEVPHH